jgi:hypothetical protein
MEIEGAFEILFDSKLFVAPKKILKLQKLLKETENWNEDDKV